MEKPATVVQFWREAGMERWFANDSAFDGRFRDRFLEAAEATSVDGLGQRPHVLVVRTERQANVRVHDAVTGDATGAGNTVRVIGHGDTTEGGSGSNALLQVDVPIPSVAAEMRILSYEISPRVPVGG